MVRIRASSRIICIMRAVIQRVTVGAWSLMERRLAKLAAGLVVLVAVGHNDSVATATASPKKFSSANF